MRSLPVNRCEEGRTAGKGGKRNYPLFIRSRYLQSHEITGICRSVRTRRSGTCFARNADVHPIIIQPAFAGGQSQQESGEPQEPARNAAPVWNDLKAFVLSAWPRKVAKR